MIYIKKGECIYVRISTGQFLFISDQKWFFSVLEKIFKLAVDEVENSREDFSSDSVSFIKYEYLKSKDFMDECKIADMQQVEYLIEILTSMNILVRSENEKTRSILVQKYDLLKKSQKSKPENLVVCNFISQKEITKLLLGFYI